MNKLLVVLIVGMVATANAISFIELVKEEWHAFKVHIKIGLFYAWFTLSIYTIFRYNNDSIWNSELCVQIWFNLHFIHYSDKSMKHKGRLLMPVFTKSHWILEYAPNILDL